MNKKPHEPVTIEVFQGKQIAECPANFRVAMKVTCEDGTVYAAGYNVYHHPNGCPYLTLRRITLKRGEQRRLDKMNKLLEVR